MEPNEFVKKKDTVGVKRGRAVASGTTGSAPMISAIFGSDPSIHILTQAIANNDVFYFPLDLFSVPEPRLYLIDTYT